VAASRTGEVIVGTLSAMLVAVLVGSGAAATPAAPAPGWSDLLGAQWPATRHAVRAGLAVMLIPVVWRLLDLPSLSQMAITVTAIMGVPSVSNDPAADQPKIVERVGGCLMPVRRVAGLLPWPFQSVLPYACRWGSGCARVRRPSQRGISCIKRTQAAMVFISTLVQGNGFTLEHPAGHQDLPGTWAAHH
jgi:uncharacterized membrane protein YccC